MSRTRFLNYFDRVKPDSRNLAPSLLRSHGWQSISKFSTVPHRATSRIRTVGWHNFTPESSSDPLSVDITTSLWWSLLEIGLALIASCLPMLTSLFNRSSLQSATRSFRKIFTPQSNNSTEAWSRISPQKIKNGSLSKSSLNDHFATDQAAVYSAGREVSNADKYIHVTHEVELFSHEK